jgi:hypothetical protein
VRSEAVDVNEIDLDPEDLEKIAILYDQIRMARRHIENNNDKQLAQDFDGHLKKVMSALGENMNQ